MQYWSRKMRTKKIKRISGKEATDNKMMRIEVPEGICYVGRYIWETVKWVKQQCSQRLFLRNTEQVQKYVKNTKIPKAKNWVVCVVEMERTRQHRGDGGGPKNYLGHSISTRKEFIFLLSYYITEWLFVNIIF